ncbi:flagellar M-ring protein FliF [Peptococcaceae bacterium]|nr:flagellar M-ring protein FliF [Peptococcaceae bacterium]
MNPRDLLTKLKEKWQNATQTNKIAIMLFGVASLVGLFYLTSFLMQTNYAPLFTNLEVQEAGVVTEKLTALNVDYRISDQGRTIEVPAEQVYQLRMQLASAGDLPGAGQGFELFDQTKMAQTDFEQQVVFQRALQEELRRTITAIEAIEQARVHLVLPRESVFIQQQGTASASVLLKLSPLTQLQPEQVRGINNLLIGSVAGLTAEQVQIIDTMGNVLNDFLQVGTDVNVVAGTLIQQQQQLRADIQKNLERRLEQFLTPVYGPGNTVAMVSVELDFSKMQTTVTEVLPGQILSEQTEESSGTHPGGGGAAGTTTQMPGADFPIVGGGGGEYEHQSRITNYELGQEVTILEQPPGAITRIFTSVIVNNQKRDPETGEWVLDEAVNQEDIEAIVAQAIGYQPGRGDEIVVQIMPFDTELRDAFVAEPVELLPWWEQNLLWIGIAVALLLLLILILFIRAKRKAKQRKQEQERLAQLQLIGVSQNEARLPEVQVSDTEKTANNLKKLAEEKPEEVAQVLKIWLKE